MRSRSSGAHSRDPLASPGARFAASGHERNLLSPLSSDLPVGLFRVKLFFLIFRKIFLFPFTPNHI